MTLRRVLVVCPSWVGDTVMASPAMRLLRDRLPGATIDALVRPGIDEVLAGSDLVDRVIVDARSGVMGVKRSAAKIRPGRYDGAVLMANSMSSALAIRVAGIARRFGYRRDGRALLLTDCLDWPRGKGAEGIVSATDFYWRLAHFVLGDGPDHRRVGAEARLELGVSEAQRATACEVLGRAGIEPGRPYAVVNPGSSSIARRWPPERFAGVCDHLARTHGFTVVVNGAPSEREVIQAVLNRASSQPLSLLDCGSSLGALKGIIAGARLLVTNETGPRFFAVASGTPVVVIFGPTDHRWSTVPVAPEAVQECVLADPTFPPDQNVNDDPHRNRIDRVEVQRVIEAVDRAVQAAAGVG
ncbi:MAG: glycosyltransferase family 9 protein [Phycisphaeraceae bacterium]|nr:glycosyltransferase family 9 protein [Phycisphaeraceae bacterium]